MGDIYDAVVDGVIASMESPDAHHLPNHFSIQLDDEDFQALLKELVVTGTTTPIDSKVKKVLLRIQQFSVTVRSSLDPDPWIMEESH